MKPYEHYRGKIIYRKKTTAIDVEILKVYKDFVVVRLTRTVTSKLRNGLVMKLPKKGWNNNMKITREYREEDFFVPAFMKK